MTRPVPSASSGAVAPLYFVRNDDAGELTEALRQFAITFMERKLPVSYQIIPEKLTRECADFLLALHERQPELIEFGQHGLRHEMNVRGRRVWREFGPERSLAEQAGDISRGRQILVELLGSSTDLEVFTPPQHKYDSNTVRAVAASGFRIFSAAAYPSPHHRLAYRAGRGLGLSSIRHHGISYHGGVRPEADIAELSIGVAADDGGSVTCAADQIAPAAMRASAYTDKVGFMFHHAVYAKPEGAAQLFAIADSLVALGAGRFRKMGELAARAGAPN